METVKALPGFYKGYLRTLRKIALYPSQLGAVTAESIATGSMGPLKAEIDKVVRPLANGWEEAWKYESILCVLLTDLQTLELLNDFAKGYYDATHPLELAEMGASAASDIVVTVLLAIFTAGVGAAANVAAKSTRLVKVAKQLERLAKLLKRVGHRHKLPKKEVPGAGVVKAEQKAKKAAKKGMPEPEPPKLQAKSEGVEKTAKKVDHDADNGVSGQKKALRSGIGTTGEGIPAERVRPEVLNEVHPDSNAAYGYSPNKGTAYEQFDFTDVDAAKKNRKIRTEYLDGSNRLENDIKTMRAGGASKEEIGHHVVNERNMQKVESRKYMSPEEIKILEERNFKKYKNPVGPTPEQAFKSQKKNLIRSGEYSSDDQVWDRVIEKSMEKDEVINTLLGIENH